MIKLNKMQIHLPGTKTKDHSIKKHQTNLFSPNKAFKKYQIQSFDQVPTKMHNKLIITNHTDNMWELLLVPFVGQAKDNTV